MAQNRPTTFRGLLNYVTPTPPMDLSTQQTTASYRCIDRPDPLEALRLSAPDSAPDDPFWRRAITALEAHIGDKLDDPLPPSVLDAISAFERECDCPIQSEGKTRTMLDLLAAVVRPCVAYLAPGHQCVVLDAPMVYSVQGDGMMSNMAVSHDKLRSTAVERKAPSVLREFEQDLCETPHRYSIRYYPGGAESILFNIYLQMSEATERVAMIYGVHYVIFVEKEDWVGPHGDREPENCLRVSKMHSCFPLACDGPRKPIPILAVMLALCLPDVKIIAARDAGKIPVSDEVVADDEEISSFVNQDNDAVDDEVARRPAGIPRSFIIMARQSQSTLPASSSPLWVDASGAMRLRLRQLLHQGPDAQTFLLEGPDAALYVAKLFKPSNELFDREYRAIRTVRERCGDVAPRVFGRFRGKRFNILLQDYGGSSLSCGLDKLPLADRSSLWSMITKLHGAHIAHRDLEPRNVVRGPDGVLRLVDFGYAELQHRCPGLDRCDELRKMRKLLG